MRRHQIQEIWIAFSFTARISHEHIIAIIGDDVK
jgi:hypothetical protein